MITVIIFIIVLGVLVFVHEFGHFIFAKRAGMKVEEFGFGFPPRIWGIKKGETVYSINLIPFGGFVKILGEEGEQRDNPRSFSSKPFGPRLKVIIAGVTMNFFLAVVLLMITNFFGLRIGIIDDTTALIARDKQVQIIEVSKDSPADKAGIKLLDEVSGFKLNGSFQAVLNAEDVQTFIRENAGQPITVVIKRNQETLDKEIVPRINPPEG
ncbi:MAG: site-2 protease family protein, partial [Patescibacteria group bacterium]